MKTFQYYGQNSISDAIGPYGLKLSLVENCHDIPYSYWGAPEAGRINNTVYVRHDTPIHSIFHETCHYVCMPKYQRSQNKIDAAGSALEENATCYLQILLSDHLPRFNRKTHMQDMDEWGYSFRLGSAQKWFSQDAEDARIWLEIREIIDKNCKLTWKLRA